MLGEIAEALVAFPSASIRLNSQAKMAPGPDGRLRLEASQLHSSNMLDRSKVDFDPIGTQVKFLRSRARPGIPIGTNTPRISRTEFHTWQVRARPIQAKVEDDGDIYLVISVPRAPSKTMIVEFPKKTCVASPFKRFRMSHARQQFLSNCGAVSASSWLKLAGRVTITGVGFWDEKHGKTGIAPNGIELHPALGFTGDCHKASTGGGGGGGGGGTCTPG